jgi:hypothetical protein
VGRWRLAGGPGARKVQLDPPDATSRTLTMYGMGNVQVDGDGATRRTLRPPRGATNAAGPPLMPEFVNPDPPNRTTRT